MKILHVITTLGTGGAEKLITEIAPLMRDQGHTVDVCVFVGGDTPFRQALIDKGIKVIEFSQHGSVYNPKHIFQLVRLMRKYDIVHTHNTAPQLFAAFGRVLCSVVLCTTEHNTSNRRRGWTWYARVDRWMYNRYDKVICISAKAEENLHNYLKECKASICTVNNGINIDTFANAQPQPSLKAGLPPDTKAVTMVAGFRWEKDQDTLIKALKLLPANFHLFLVGDGVRRPELQALADGEGVADRVHFMGLRTDVPQILKSSDYVVMSSHFEGLSLSSVEGMAAAKPMFASDVDGLREVVGGYGVLFEHQDAKDFADKILALDADAAQYRAVAAACARHAQAYDINLMVANYLAAYHTLAAD